jgi:hypothetical protein
MDHPFILGGGLYRALQPIGWRSWELVPPGHANQTYILSRRNLEPVTGMDGEAAQAVTERYREDFEKPSPAVPYTLTIGTIGKK